MITARIALAVLLGFLSGCVAEAIPTPVITPVSPASPAPSATPQIELQQCENDEVLPAYRLGYPTDWFVHPADPATDVSPCTYFAAEPFDYFVPARADDAPWSIEVKVVRGCLLSEQDPFSEESEMVDGFPATISEYSHGENLHRYNWRVALIDVPDCDLNRTGLIQTAGWQAGDYDTNKRFVDLMARSWDFLTEGR